MQGSMQVQGSDLPKIFIKVHMQGDLYYSPASCGCLQHLASQKPRTEGQKHKQN